MSDDEITIDSLTPSEISWLRARRRDERKRERINELAKIIDDAQEELRKLDRDHPKLPYSEQRRGRAPDGGIPVL